MQREVCPVKMAGHLSGRIRKWLQNPEKILTEWVKEGMTVLDLGSGPGFFSVEAAKMVGRSGKVIAADLQKGMLEILKNRIQGTEIENRIVLHKCEKDKIGILEKVDCALAFYVLHEVPDQERLLKELGSTLKVDGRLYMIEPKLHVSRGAFEETVKKAEKIGFEPLDRPKVFLSRAAVFKR